MEKIITGRVPGGREIFRIFARSRSNKFYFRFGQTSTSKGSSFFVLIKDKSITSHYGPTINTVHCALVDILSETFIFKYVMTKILILQFSRCH